ncbi:CHAT domain-containing protein [Larkinella punicea]|uniref:CHAT domain-containing protein n=1 Tax=Larkinella punicea TaxID=2315727 RepID=A0A368JS18_9BACT|nr:CHAT domain-containing protein [Larkinella punicea]RCR70428.1 CHAT domain-containing protein [Larkinella punicea]
MDTLLFCFANDRDHPLPSLRDEDDGIDRLLDLRSSKGHFQKVRESFATTSSVADKLATYQNTLSLFHFSGHAGSTVLQLEDTVARGVGIAQLLGRCPNLKLVFLNGCSTLQHIRLLAAQNVKAAIIATSTPIEDKAASAFALTFYRALVNQHSVEESLDMAQLKLQVTEATTIQVVNRAMIDLSEEEVTRNLWYFHRPSDEAARWELPTAAEQTAVEYKPNTVLRNALFNALNKYEPGLRDKFMQVSKQSPESQILWINDAILSRLPYPIAEPLRRLFTPPFSPEGKKLPIPSTRERLLNYTALFESALDLLMITLLAQVLDRLIRYRKEGAEPPMTADTTALLQRLVTEGWSNLEPHQLERSLRQLSQFLADSQIKLFVPEMQELARQFDERETFYECFLFFDDLRRRLAGKAGVANIPSLCQVGEDQLVELCKRLGFWANYQLESYKNIRVVRFFYRQEEYKHEKAVLRTTQNPYEDKSFQEINLTNPWASQSVLLVKVRRETATGEPEVADFLNLSPLLIDQNVYIKSNVFDPYSFHSSQPGTLRFKHIARPEDPLLSVSFKPSETELLQKQDFTTLREQFSTVLALLSLPDPLATAENEPILSNTDTNIDLLSLSD